MIVSFEWLIDLEYKKKKKKVNPIEPHFDIGKKSTKVDVIKKFIIDKKIF